MVVLRGPEAHSNTVTLRPEHINASATYQGTWWHNYRKILQTKLTGAKLQELAVTLTRHSSVLIEYQRVD